MNSTIKLLISTIIVLANAEYTFCNQHGPRLVSNAKELGSALREERVTNIVIKGKIRLTKENWVPGGTAFIRNGRHVILQSDQEAPASAVLDLGTLMDAIHVAGGSHLDLRRLRIPNSGNRRLSRPSERVRLQVAGIFALWPSVTLAKDSRMSFSESVFYYWSDKEWDSCDKFREAATKILNPKGIPNMLEWSASDTQVYIKGSQNTSQNLINIVNKKVYVGAFNTTRINHTLVCLPDPFKDESGSISLLALCVALFTLAAAAAIAHISGFIRLTPQRAGPDIAAHPSWEGQSLHGSPLHTHSSAGSQSSRSNSAVEHLSGLVRDRQRATVGGLELGEMLGRGSFGKVYKGRWRGAIVAVKVVAHDRSLASLAETLRESALSTSIQHPNVVTTFKVRTVRSRHDSDNPRGAAATWALGEENCLDEAAGNGDRLLKRAMSVSVPGIASNRTPTSRSSLTKLPSPLRRSMSALPEELKTPVGSGAVNEEDDEPEPLSMAVKAGRSYPMPAAEKLNDDREPLLMSNKAGRSNPMPPTSELDDEPEPLSMSMKAGKPRMDHAADDKDEPEPLSMSMKAGRSLQAHAAQEPDDDREPLSMSMKAGRLYAMPTAEELDDQPGPLSVSMKASGPIFAADDKDEPEPFSMSMKSGRLSMVSAGINGVNGQQNADQSEPITMANKAGESAAAAAAAAADVAHRTALAGSCQQNGLQRTHDDEPEPLGMYGKSSRQVHITADAEGEAASAVEGKGGNADAGEGNSDGDPQPLLRSKKAGNATLLQAQEEPSGVHTPEIADQPAALGLETTLFQNQSAYGTMDPALSGTAAAVLPGRISSLAGQAMNRLLGFGRAPSGPEGTPNKANGTPLDSRPAVPSSLLSEGHSTAMSDGNVAEQMQKAAAEKGTDLLETWLILEYCDQGSFDHAIRSGQYTNDLASGVLCLMDIAAGMEHLHSLGVLHADLKGANVLMKSAAKSNYDSRGYTCKLADFGLSRVMENNSTHVSTSTYGTAAYMPAELLMEGKMTKAADVYSFAMLMFELLTGNQLFESMRQSQIICKVITGWRPNIPEGSPPSYVALMVDCWHVNMEQRPPFSAILLRLRSVLKELRMTAS